MLKPIKRTFSFYKKIFEHFSLEPPLLNFAVIEDFSVLDMILPISSDSTDILLMCKESFLKDKIKKVTVNYCIMKQSCSIINLNKSIIYDKNDEESLLKFYNDNNTIFDDTDFTLEEDKIFYKGKEIKSKYYFLNNFLSKYGQKLDLDDLYLAYYIPRESYEYIHCYNKTKNQYSSSDNDKDFPNVEKIYNKIDKNKYEDDEIVEYIFANKIGKIFISNYKKITKVKNVFIRDQTKKEYIAQFILELLIYLFFKSVSKKRKN